MVGHVTETTAKVWVDIEDRTNIDAVAYQQGKSVRGSYNYEWNTLGFEGLLPDAPVHVVLKTKSQNVDETEDLFFKTAAPPENTGTLRIAFGSCSKDSRLPYVPVWEAMAHEKADLSIFVGDNSYFIVGEGDWSTSGPVGDWNSEKQMYDRHMITRNNAYLQNLLRTTPMYGVWDDHDYGPNNADRELESKDEALNIFKKVWANPYYGTPETPGIFSKFRRGPADIFLMDDRYYKYVKTNRHPDVPDEEAEIWGEGQLEWLMNELKRSKAPVKIIANGTQIISKDGRGEGHFNEAPKEIEKLLNFLKKNKIGGVVVLSGDRHITEVLRLEQDGAPDIVEFTSSPFQQGSEVAFLDRDHPTHEWAMRGNSYGLVTIDVTGKNKGSVKFEMRDANNYVPKRNAKGDRAVAEYSLESLSYED
jgi:alkaline phosphatase D